MSSRKRVSGVRINGSSSDQRRRDLITGIMIVAVVAVIIIIVAVAVHSAHRGATVPPKTAGNGTSQTQQAKQTQQAQNSSTRNIQGMTVQDVKVGTGATANNGESVTVNYVGTLTNGTVFDSSIARNQPFTFKLGAGQVIKGWDLGVAGMKVGGERKLIIPPSLGYGSSANGSIPANSTLDFTVTLLSVGSK